MAAQDLQKSGFNLDTLREEIGNDKREPLPEMPLPTREKAPPKSVDIPTEKPSENMRKNIDDDSKKKPIVLSVPAQKEEQKSNAKQSEKEIGRHTENQDWKSKGLEVSDFLKEQTKKLASAPTKLIAEAEERADIRLTRVKQARERWEREAASYAANVAKLAHELRQVVANRSAEKEEVVYLREQIRIQRQVAEQSQIERDAATNELEAVALRQVDSLQAEVAALRREKRRADQLDKELRALKETHNSGQNHQNNNSSTKFSTTTEMQHIKLQLQAARSAAAASARAARGEIELERQSAATWEQKAARLKIELRQALAATAKAEQENDALRRERDILKSASKAKSRRDQDADALKSALKLAMEARHSLEQALSKSREEYQAALQAKTQAEQKMYNDAEMWKGEVAAARQAAREARNALLSHTSTDNDSISINNHNRDENKKIESGATEYLRSVVSTALPSSNSPVIAPGGQHRPDTATRQRLIPVLRSLLGLPHETVESSIEALARTPAGGDFAIALLSAHPTDIVQSKHAAQLQEQRSKLLQLENLLDDLRSKLAFTESAHQETIRSSAQEQAKLIKFYESQVNEALAISKRNDSNCVQLAATADHARAQATAAQAAQAHFEQKISQLIDNRKDGLDANQLDYLRSTLICFLRGFSQPKLRSQLLPVLVQILKIPPDDPMAEEILHIADHLSTS
eukprot:CAMPEP_0197288558 /NCGR_PEP_ID=MMETSP0890-20130614/5669_1 /TAXON_ID=44058 ORGANISM="Aureoumbra lagunensis, Strain CCMP1510" /NCGR_SAMPLE_ID=MMETSP0890 /ASSEMBLY_ACC=CAM_ASM_000533 /LENGTH=694 /DNA_ID=CAMNT_0042759367 /DNA_START=79 /DNA_END=2163 /DNA_ORIENTATION=+